MKIKKGTKKIWSAINNKLRLIPTDGARCARNGYKHGSGIFTNLWANVEGEKGDE